jgi:hypothetical protein
MGKVKGYLMEIQELIFAALMAGHRSAEDVYEFVHKHYPVASREDCNSEYDKITRQFYS